MNEEELAKFKNIQQSYLLDVENAKYNPQSTALEIMKLKNQLQSYKDKEDKLRKYINQLKELYKDNYSEFSKDDYMIIPSIEEILDGSDGNE